MKQIIAFFSLLCFVWSSFFGLDTSSFIKSGRTISAAASEESSSEENLSRGLSSSDLRTKQVWSSADYCVVPGDIYQLVYAAGTAIISTEVILDASYKLRVHNLGVLDCRNKTYIELRSQVENLVAKNYPMSGVQFILKSPGVFRIRTKGEVVKSEELVADGVTRLSELYDRLDLTARASFRNIKITKSNGRSRTYDLFKFYREADISQNPYLAPGDVIDIGQRGRKISISGEVYRPGTYFLNDSDTVADVLSYYAGGLTANSSTERVYITRQAAIGETNGKTVTISYDELATSPDAILYDYDVIFIENRQEFKPIAFFEGALNIPAESELLTSKTDSKTATESQRVPYRFQPGAMLSQAVIEHSSLFKVTADLENVFIQRNEEFISVNIWNFLYKKDFSGDVALKNGDIILIPFKQLSVSVSGAVVRPGFYPYVPNRDINYYVNLAGGISEMCSSGKNIKVTDMNNNRIEDTSIVFPETCIYVPYNSFSYRFNKYAPTITTLLSITATTISIMATLGAFD